MGRRRYVSVESAVQVLKKYIKYFVPDLPPRSSEVWQIISNELENKWSTDCVRINVRQDRKKILTIARQECGYLTENSNKSEGDVDDDLNCDNLNYIDISESICSDSDNDNDDDENNKDKDYVPENWYVCDSNEIEEFDVKISRKAWNKIIIKNVDSKGHRHHKLRKDVWTDVIAFAFWKQYRLKCSFMFKKNVITQKGYNYLSIYGYCKSKKCGNRLFGFIEHDPGEEGPVIITIKCRDTRYDDHEDLQRPLRGQRRKIICKKVQDLGVLAYRKQAAERLLKAGDTGCPFLPQSNVLYTAKTEFLNAELGVKPIDKKNVTKAIDRIKAHPNYKDWIWIII